VLSVAAAPFFVWHNYVICYKYALILTKLAQLGLKSNTYPGWGVIGKGGLLNRLFRIIPG